MRREYAIDFERLHAEHYGGNLYFIDETGVNVSMRPFYGRSPIGTAPVVTVNKLHTRNISVCAVMTVNGLQHYAMQVRAYNRYSFESFIRETMNILTMRGERNGVLIMDNASIHKTTNVIQAIEEMGFRYKFLAPYSPFLNPIENLFSTWKSYIRRDASQTEDELFLSINRSSEQITSTKCGNCCVKMLEYIERSKNGEIIED